MSESASPPQKIVVLTNDPAASNPPWTDSQLEFETVSCPEQALARLESEQYSAIFIDRPSLGEKWLRCWSREHRILDQVPDAVAIVNSRNEIQWANERLTEWFPETDWVGLNFYQAIGQPDMMGPSNSPCANALANQKTARTLLRFKNNRYLEMHATPLIEEGEGSADRLIITLHDVSDEKLEQEKLHALHRAGMELADLTTEEVCNMEVDDRIELLKSNILHYTKQLLNFDVVEIRLLDFENNQLEKLISVGIESEASNRVMKAEVTGNGVTGFVVATGKSYLCEDTREDPLYVDGLIGARSSLTVPLIYHDEVIGSFNVESPQPGGFDETDLQFLEIFARDIAIALNTLDLLVAQKANTARQSIDAIYSAVALPVDEILNDTVHVIAEFSGDSAELSQRLRSILSNARFIKHTIHRVGERLMPGDSKTSLNPQDHRPALRDRRVLVIDADETVRNSAHVLLERYDVDVETAHAGNEALLMINNCTDEEQYAAIIADIRLPDIKGHELLAELQRNHPNPPLILMTGFGYDPGHAIVKARQAGLPADAVLYKPFRLDQLLATVEAAVTRWESQRHSNTSRPTAESEGGIADESGDSQMGSSGGKRAADQAE